MTSPVHNSGACHTRAPAENRAPARDFLPELQKALKGHRAPSEPGPERLSVSSKERYEPPTGENLRIRWTLPGETKQADGPDGPDGANGAGGADDPTAPPPPDDSDPGSTPEVPDSATWRPRSIDDMTAHARESGSFRYDPASRTWIQIANYEDPVPQTDPYGRNTWAQNELSFEQQNSGRYTWDAGLDRWVEYLPGEVPSNMPGGYGAQGRTNAAPVYPERWRAVDLGPGIGIKLVPDYGPKGFKEPAGAAVETPRPEPIEGRPSPTPPPAA